MRRFWLIFLLVFAIPFYADAATISSGGGHQIQDEGATPLAQKPKLNFTGAGVSVANPVGQDYTEVNIGQAAIPEPNYYVAGYNADGELINYSTGISHLYYYPNSLTLTNDFETGVTGWTCNSCGLAPQSNPNTFVTGSKSMAFDGNSGGATIVEEAITVMVGTPYTISAWVYDTTATNTVDLRIRDTSYTGGANLCSASTTAAWEDGWVRLTCSTPATNTDTSLYVQIVTNEDVTDIYVDDVQLSIQDVTPYSVKLQDDGFVHCKIGNCAAFNGGHTHIYTADSASLEPTTGLTLSAWVFPTSEKNGVLIDKGAGTQYSLQVISDTYYDSKVKFKLTNNSSGISQTTTNAYYIYQWTHVVAQISGTAGTGADDTVYFYINSTLVDTITGQNYQMPAHATGVYIGSSTDLAMGFRGYMDDVRVYSASISAADITTMYNSGNGTACTGSETSIIACWNLNETSGTTAVSLPAGFNGTLASSTGSNISGWRNCKLSNCVQFDGVDDYIGVKSAPDISMSSTLSFSFWLYRGVDTGGTEVIASKSDADYPSNIRDYDFILSILPTDVLRLLISKNDESYTSIASTTTISAGQWYHVVITKDATEFKMYLNNTIEGSPTIVGTMGDMRVTSMPLEFGRYSNGGSSFYGFTGKIDDFQIYNVALGTTPIATLYNSGNGTACVGAETNLAACWPFNESSGQVTYQTKDQTGIGSDANDCTTSPCKTLQATINKILQYYAGTTVVNIASVSMFPESPVINGYNNAGDFTFTLRGYSNPTPNQFTDAPTLSGTSTGSNTANFPKDTLSLFNDTNVGTTLANGTLTNSPTWTSSGGVNNQYGYLDFVPASSQYVTMGNIASLEATTNFTAMTWFKVDEPTLMQLISKRESSGDFNGWSIRATNDTTIAAFTTYSTTNISLNITVPSLGTGWHHVAYTITNNVGQLYLDGTAIGSSGTGVGTITTTSAIFSVGSLNGASQFMDGGIDEVGIFNTALTQAQIRTYCGWTGSACGGNQLSNNTSGLVHLYHLNNAVTGGTTEYDSIEAAFSGDVLAGDLLYIQSGSGSGTWARVQSKQSATQLAAVTRWETTPTSSSTYQIFSNKYLPKIHANNGVYGLRIRNSRGINVDRLYITKAQYNLLAEFSQISSITKSVFDKSRYLASGVQDLSSITSYTYNYSTLNTGEAFRLYKSSTAVSVSSNMLTKSFTGISGYWASSMDNVYYNYLYSCNYYCLDVEQNFTSYGLGYSRIEKGGYGGIVAANGSVLTAVAPVTISGNGNYGTGILISNNAAFNADFYGSLLLSDLEIKNHVTGLAGQRISDCQAGDRMGSTASCDAFTYSGNTTDKKILSSNDSISSNPPTAYSCGASPSVASASRAASGQVALSAGTITSCTLIFPVTWNAAPFCTVSGSNTGVTLAVTTTTTTLSITSSASMANHVIRYNCGLQL